jgi:hypothetical protein
VAEEKLDLLQVAAILATELRAGPAQVVCTEVFDPNLPCRLLDDRPKWPQSSRSSPINFPLLDSGSSRRPSSILATTIQIILKHYAKYLSKLLHSGGQWEFRHLVSYLFRGKKMDAILLEYLHSFL